MEKTWLHDLTSIEDDIIIVTVLAVGKRERSNVYSKALDRLDD